MEVVQLFNSNGQTSGSSAPDNEVTITAIIVAREYHKHITFDLGTTAKLSRLLAMGRGYTRIVEDTDLLNKINQSSRDRVMEL